MEGDDKAGRPVYHLERIVPEALWQRNGSRYLGSLEDGGLELDAFVVKGYGSRKLIITDSIDETCKDSYCKFVEVELGDREVGLDYAEGLLPCYWRSRDAE